MPESTDQMAENHKSALPPSTVEMAEAFAFSTPPDDLRATLVAVWESCAKYVLETENKFKSKLTRDLGKQYLESLPDSIVGRIDKFRDLPPSKINGHEGITVFYMSALTVMGGVASRLQKIYPISSWPQNFNLDEYVVEAIRNSKVNDVDFIKWVAPQFFPLQIYALRLRDGLAVSKGVPTSPYTRKIRASVAGKAKAKGAESIKTLMLDVFESNPGKLSGCASAKDIFREFEHDLYERFVGYQDDLKKSGASGSGYALEIGYYGLTEKFNQWLKDDLAFKWRLGLLPGVSAELRGELTQGLKEWLPTAAYEADIE